MLVQLNKRNEAIELITKSIAFISQQRYSENRNASLIGYANLVARASWAFYEDQELFLIQYMRIMHLIAEKL